MPAVEEALYARVVADSSFTALCSTRLYPGFAPQGATFPFVVYRMIDAGHTHHMGGASGLADYRIEFEVFAETYAGAKAIMEVLRLRLDSFRGSVTVGLSSLTIRNCFIDDDSVETLTPTDAGQEAIYRGSARYNVWAAESVPSHS